MAIRTGWLNDVDLTGRSWWSVAEEIGTRFGSGAVRQLLNENFFEQFPSFSAADRARLWEYVGGVIAGEQAAADDGLGDVLRSAVALTAGSVGFGVGGATGAALATGNDLKTAAALDVAGLAAAPALAAGLAAGGAAAASSAELTATAGGLDYASVAGLDLAGAGVPVVATGAVAAGAGAAGFAAQAGAAVKAALAAGKALVTAAGVVKALDGAGSKSAAAPARAPMPARAAASGFGEFVPVILAAIVVAFLVVRA